MPAFAERPFKGTSPRAAERTAAAPQGRDTRGPRQTDGGDEERSALAPQQVGIPRN